MKFKLKNPPRTFKPRGDDLIIISDHGDIEMESGEQLTFVKPGGAQYDMVRKDWGYIASPSVNDRLIKQNFKLALVSNSGGMVYAMAVDQDKMKEFENYCRTEEQEVLEWLDEKPLNNK